jgi:biopolymer transport protein ExbB/TolQ
MRQVAEIQIAQVTQADMPSAGVLLSPDLFVSIVVGLVGAIVAGLVKRNLADNERRIAQLENAVSQSERRKDEIEKAILQANLENESRYVRREDWLRHIVQVEAKMDAIVRKLDEFMDRELEHYRSRQ